MNQFDAIIIGAGPAGLTAGIYLARAKKQVLIVEKSIAGGQVNLTHAVANYPGIPETSGYQLASQMKKQALDFGCEIITGVKINTLELDGEVKKVSLEGKGDFSAPAVILATGGSSKNLGLASEEKFTGRGISYCATCDGDFFTGQDIVVVGGGNSALEEAVALTRYVSSVTVVHMLDHFQAFSHAVEEAAENPKISFLLETAVEEFSGKEELEGVVVKNLSTGEKRVLNAAGAFVFIGYQPNTDFLKGLVPLNEAGEILVDENLQTGIPGVYAAGDARVKKHRQITTAVADGTVTALNALQFLDEYAKKVSPGAL
jgi:thioredoxin reductase (NADPH)